ncbi:MAG: hypothetical protein AAFY64_00070, partial [Pseudomonadota bacterium]
HLSRRDGPSPLQMPRRLIEATVRNVKWSRFMTTDAKFAYLTTAPAAMQLLDWRRRVQQLYADIRAFNDPVAAHAHWVRKRTAMMRYHPQSPFDAQMRPVGHAGQVYHWPYDPEWCFEVSVEPAFGDTGSRQDLGADGDIALSPPEV